MITATVLCTECDRPVPDSLPLCRTCGDGVVTALLAVPSLIADLTITRSRLDRVGGSRDGGRSAETALPVRAIGRRGVELVGDRALMRLQTAVSTWARLLAEELRVEIPVGAPGLIVLVHNGRGPRRDRAAIPLTPASPLEQAAIWLACHPHELRRHEAAHDLLVDVTHGVAGLRVAVDRPIELRYLGQCAGHLTDGSVCGSELRAALDASWVRCRRCRMQWEIARIEADARAAVEDSLYPLADMARVLAGLGATIPRPTLYTWAQRRRMEPRGWQHIDNEGRRRITDHRIAEGDQQVYRLGDALKLAARDEREGGSAA